MTVEDFFALEAKGVDCELINGELRIRGDSSGDRPMTTRGYPHSVVMINLGYLLRSWIERQPKPRGVVIGGEARVRIRTDPETIVGIDVAYISAELAGRTHPDALLVDGPPTLAIEIHSPSDKQQDIVDKIRVYIDAGIPLVWEVNPAFKTVTVHCPGLPPVLYNEHQELTAEPHLPGFRVRVAEVFEP
jgi:Uma2 family endonuclease